MSKITTTQVIELIASQYGDASAQQGAEYADQIGYADAEEFFSLALSKILYSNDQLEYGDRYPVEPGSLDDLI